MNWNAIGAGGEILGAIAVVISLGYLATQIRSNTSALRRAASRDAVTGVNGWFASVTTDNATANLFGRGVENFASLSADESARFRFIYFQLFKVIEDMHFQYEEGVLDEEQWEGWRWVATQYLASPGGQEYWGLINRGFSKRFHDFYASLQPARDYIRAGQHAVRRAEVAIPDRAVRATPDR
jgi:hypothetical protein